jgi:hypothetical protein
MNPNLLLAALAGLWIASAPAVDWTAAQWSLPKGATRDGNVLTVTLEQTGTAMATVPVDLSPYAGKCIAAKIRVSAVDLQRGSQAWLGYKFMLSYKDAKTGGREWPGAPCLTGTFDWKESSFTCDLRGKDPADARLSLGLQDTRGSVSFDLASLVIEETKPLFDLDLSDRKCAYTPELKARPVKRGVMLPSGRCTEDDFKTLRGWGAPLARYQMVRGWGKIEDNRDIAEYAAWVDSKLDHLVNDVLPWAEKYGVDIVVDLHVAPGGLEKSHEMAMFHDERYADAFVEIWKRIATRCKGRPRLRSHQRTGPADTRDRGVGLSRTPGSRGESRARNRSRDAHRHRIKRERRTRRLPVPAGARPHGRHLPGPYVPSGRIHSSGRERVEELRLASDGLSGSVEGLDEGIPPEGTRAGAAVPAPSRRADLRWRVLGDRVGGGRRPVSRGLHFDLQ